jgi:hypothetical protein
MSDHYVLLDQTEVSKLLGGVPVNTLKDYRAKGKGPTSALIGGKVKYRKSDVYAWIDQQFARSDRSSTVTAFTPLGKRSAQSV